MEGSEMEQNKTKFSIQNYLGIYPVLSGSQLTIVLKN